MMPHSEERSVVFLLFSCILLTRMCRGSLYLTINGSGLVIPTDGSGRIFIMDIGRSNAKALICQSTMPTSTGTSDWYYNPTSLSLDPNDRIIVSEENDKGWFRNRNVQNGIVRLFKDGVVASPVEGVFTCEIAEDPDSPISLGIYYAITVDVVLEVLSAKDKIISVTCTAKGGTVLTSALTEPGGATHELQLEGMQRRRGDDTYSITLHNIAGGNDGDKYECIATNGVSHEPSDIEILRVASSPIIEAVEQISPTALQLEWSQPSEAAPVTGYVVYYTDGITERSKRVASSHMRTNLTHLSPNQAYTIILEATSVQLSGVSYAMELFLNGGDLESSHNPTSSNGIAENPLLLVVIVAVILIGIIAIVGMSIATAMIITRKCTRKPQERLQEGTASVTAQPKPAYTQTLPILEEMTANISYNYVGPKYYTCSSSNEAASVEMKTHINMDNESLYDVSN